MSDPGLADFILVHIPGQGGKIIQMLQFLDGTGYSDYEHVALYIGGGVVIEMASGGIQADKVAKYDDRPHRWSTGKIPLSNQQRNGIVSAGQEYLAAGTGYSWEDYAALALRHFHIPAPGLQKYIASTGHMICSQLIAACYRDGGAPLYDRWTGYVTPGDLNVKLGPE
jgi:uncharacterized protein YycO